MESYFSPHRSYILSDRMPRRINPHSSFFQSSVQRTSVKRTIDNKRTNRRKIRARTKEENKVTLNRSLRKATSKAREGKGRTISVSVVLFRAPRGIVGSVRENCRFDNPPRKVTRGKIGGESVEERKEGRKERLSVFFDVCPRRDGRSNDAG